MIHTCDMMLHPPKVLFLLFLGSFGRHNTIIAKVKPEIRVVKVAL